MIRLLGWQISLLYKRLCVPSRLKMNTADRTYLERYIFKDLILNKQIKKILFVGVHQYSSWYYGLFNCFTQIKFWTIDPAFQSKNKQHLQSNFDLLALEKFSNSFDVIIINGVFNYGINQTEDKIKAIHIAEQTLKSGGLLLLGYREGEQYGDFDPSFLLGSKFIIEQKIHSSLLAPHHASNNHCYLWLKKLASTESIPSV
ncbi:MAG: hypothetical protein K0Q57_50 [Gammaproteobacteria bacterium]|jgi:hypothetical protein|nr:hypothetical protein [Gammaproteobacteria bacterium]